MQRILKMTPVKGVTCIQILRQWKWLYSGFKVSLGLAMAFSVTLLLAMEVGLRMHKRYECKGFFPILKRAEWLINLGEMSESRCWPSVRSIIFYKSLY
jgi:hypothetical protein